MFIRPNQVVEEYLAGAAYLATTPVVTRIRERHVKELQGAVESAIQALSVSLIFGAKRSRHL